MPFHEYDRVIFNKNPLDKVVCQLRFPSILKIDVDIPYEYQEKIREDFPDYNESNDIKLEVKSDEASQVPSDLIKEISKTQGNKNHQFKSDDGIWSINLTRNFLALTTLNYVQWEDFLSKFKKVVEAFIEIYNPNYYSRIGLRYINVFQKSKLNLEKSSWKQLFNEHIIGLLGSEELEGEILAFENKYEIKLSDAESKVRILTGFVKSLDNEEIAYVIDNDFYTNIKTPIENMSERLEFYHSISSNLIRWCITEKLFQAMEPNKHETK